jgi:hypothetical protein
MRLWLREDKTGETSVIVSEVETRTGADLENVARAVSEQVFAHCTQALALDPQERGVVERGEDVAVG